MKVVCLLASPRPKGNSTAIAGRFCERAEKNGASIQRFSLNKLTYRGCQACMTCKTKLDRCVLKDDLAEVLEAIRDADVLVLATPVYFGEVSSQLKAFIDRTFSYLTPDYATSAAPSRLKAGKRLVFIQTQGQPDEKQFADIFPRYDYFFKWYGFNDNLLIRGCGLMADADAQARSDIMEAAEKTADMLFQKS
jgi:multimeric flavodoxin WrbA